MKSTRVFAAALLLAGGAVAFVAAPAYAAIVPTDPPPGASDQICEGLDSTKINLDGEQETFEISAEEGFVITGFCVKSGDDNSDGGPEYYLVDPPTNTVTISHSTGRDISHYSFSFEKVATTPPTTPPATTPPGTTPPETTPATTPPASTTPPAGGGDGAAALAETGFENGWLAFIGIGALALGGALIAPRLIAKRR
jgi:LPXTG-motif cell wall-anchored protein